MVETNPTALQAEALSTDLRSWCREILHQRTRDQIDTIMGLGYDLNQSSQRQDRLRGELEGLVAKELLRRYGVRASLKSVEQQLTEAESVARRHKGLKVLEQSVLLDQAETYIKELSPAASLIESLEAKRKRKEKLYEWINNNPGETDSDQLKLHNHKRELADIETEISALEQRGSAIVLRLEDRFDHLNDNDVGRRKLRGIIDVKKIIADHGGDPEAVRCFDHPDPELLPYASLMACREAGAASLQSVFGVYEWSGAPLVFLINEQQAGCNLEHLHLVLSMHGDAPYMAVLRRGQVILYRLGLDHRSINAAIVHPDVDPSDLFPVLANCRPEPSGRRMQHITEIILGLLGNAIRGLREEETGMSDPQITSLVGRVLFTRFLQDRDLIPHTIVQTEEHGDRAMHLFDGPSQATKICVWLNKIFNSALLPLDLAVLERLPPEIFAKLGHIMLRVEGGQLTSGWEKRWDWLDFSHIPVSVLMQACEGYMRTHVPAMQRKEGEYYTPRHVAELLTSAAFSSWSEEKPVQNARVLDPAAGAGIVLITAYRELVAAQWRTTGKRPDTVRLRDILYNQITGFEIDEEALQFVALGLCLTAIELDPNPKPIERLRFDHNFAGHTLHLVDSLGSLAVLVGQEHIGAYDIVIGVPPWMTNTNLSAWKAVRRDAGRTATDRMGEAAHPSLPNESLDLSFLWGAMHWARPGGRIALAMHGRLLVQRAEGMAEARAAVFAALDVTGVINGAELLATSFWPKLSAPFCLLLARNQRPAPGAAFCYVNLHEEPELNKSGGWRIDPNYAEMVPSEAVQTRPEILKVLSRGTMLDEEILENISRRELPTIGDYWESRATDGFILRSGYESSGDSGETHSGGENGSLSEYFSDITDIDVDSMRDVETTPRNPIESRDDIADSPKITGAFMAPLVIIHQIPSAHQARLSVACSLRNVADRQNVYGLSFGGKITSGGKITRKFSAAYMFLLLGSRLVYWFIFMKSEHLVLNKACIEREIIESIPFIPPENLSSIDRKNARALFAALADQRTPDGWSSVDEWVAGLYGLSPPDVQVMNDTLEMGLPFAANRKHASSPADNRDLADFQSALEAQLAPWGERLGRRFVIKVQQVREPIPWRIMTISGDSSDVPPNPDEGREILRLADRMTATEVIHPDPQHDRIWLARLNQKRYWTRSLARLVARRIIWEHSTFLQGVGHA